MDTPSQTRRIATLRKFAQLISAVVCLIGVGALLGWLFDLAILKSGWPNWPTMKPNTALSFCLLGISLWLLSSGRTRIYSLPLAQSLGLGTSVLGLLTLSQFGFGWDLGIDRWLFRAAVEQDGALPGRMSPLTAFSFTLIGGGLIFWGWRSRIVEPITQLLPLIVGTVNVLVLAGYIYDIRALANFGFATSIAIHSAVAFLLLSIAWLCARADLEPMLTFTGDLSGGQLARSLLPAIFFLIFLLGWLEALGERANLYNARYFGILLSVSAALLLAVLIWASTARLERTDRKRRQAEVSVRASEERYRTTLDQMLEGCQIIDQDWRYVYINEAAVRHGHQTKENLLGHRMMDVYPGIETTPLFTTLKRCMSERAAQQMENEFTYPDGTSGWFELSIQPVAEGLFILSIDVTQRKRVEEEIYKINADLELLIANRNASLQEALLTTEALYDVSRSVAKSNQLDDVLGAIVDSVVTALSADRVTIITFDQTARRVVHLVAGGPGAAQVNAAVSYDELQAGLSGWVLRERRSALSPKGVPDPRESEPVRQRRIETQCGAIVVVPLQHSGEVLGTITMINTPEQREFSEPDVELLEAIASQAAGVIVNTELITQLKTTNERLQQQGAALQYQNGFFSALHQITLDLLSRRELDELLQALIVHSTKLLDATYGELMLIEDNALVVHATTDNQTFLIGDTVKRSEALLSWQAFDTRQPCVLADYSTWPHRRAIYNDLALHAVANFPILTGLECVGVLGFGRDRPGYEFDPSQIQYGNLFSQLAALVIDNAQLRETLHQQSIRDPLTGLFNRRYMEETLAQNLHRVARASLPLGIIMIDLDHFKAYNDSFGHGGGDALLREFGKFLQNSVRGDDVACRYGGEEFTLILPEASLEIACRRAEFLRLAAKDFRVEYAQQQLSPISLSLGVAAFPEHGDSPQTLLEAADSALYQAKERGRDRVVVAASPGSTQAGKQ